MSSSAKRSSGGGARLLPPEVNRILYVRNLPFKISAAELYDIFGAHGAVRQIRLGVAPATRGTAYVVYEDIYDAKAAVERLMVGPMLSSLMVNLGTQEMLKFETSSLF
ncbi:hypothetical protein MMPV_003201 [Pyropia vietnamensis]